MSAPLLAFPLSNAFTFSSLNFFKDLLGMKKNISSRSNEKPEFLKLFYAGCLVGLFSSILQSPFDLYKIIMQTEN
jgi:hypothetical protein